MVGAPQNGLYAPFKWLDEHVHVSKAGETVLFAKLDGIDFECRTDESLEEQHGRLLTAFQALEGIRHKHYLVKLDGVELEEVSSPDPVTDKTLRARRDFLQARDTKKPLCTMSLYLCLVHEPKRRFQRNQAGLLKVSRKELNASVKHLYESLQTVSEAVGDLLGITVMHRREVHTFLRFLACLDPELAASEPLDYDDNIDHWLTSNMLDINPSGIKTGGRKVEVLTLRKRPKMTSANSLREILSVPGNFVVSAEFKQEAPDKTRQDAQTARDHWNLFKWAYSLQALAALIKDKGETRDKEPDKASAHKVELLDQAILSLAQGNTYGAFDFTIVVFGENAETASRKLINIVGNQQGSLIREKAYATACFAALVPGHTPKWKEKLHQRRRKLSLAQFIDLMPVYNHSTGQKVNPITGKNALLQLVTSDKTRFDFNLVPPQAPNKGVWVLGRVGSGKSSFMQLCIDHGQKDQPYTLILDGLGGSYRTLTRKHNGTYFELDPEGEKWQFTINPFRTEDGRKNRQYLSMLVRTCMATGGYRATAEKNQILYKEVARILSEVPLEERRLSCLRLPDKMTPYLAPWVGDGQYSHIFDNAADTLHLGRFQCIDFSGLMEFPDVVQPLLFHIFRCWNQVVYNDELLTVEKDMFVDEGWDLISYPAARRYMQAAARTWRKRLGGLILGSQSLVELEKSGMLALMNELCPLKLLLSNPGGDFKRYSEVLKMNEKQVELYSKLHEPGSGLMISSTLSKVFHTPLDALALWTYRNDPFGNQQRNQAIAAHNGDILKALESLAASA